VHETLNVLQAFVAGVLLGTMFFGGLWWTVQKGISCKRPAIWFLGSLFFRTSIATAGFYLVCVGHWERLPVCLVGFVIARLIVTRCTRQTDRPTCLAQEASHAPYSR